MGPSRPLGNGLGNASLAVLPIAFLAPIVPTRVWGARAAVGLLLASVTVSAASAQAHGRIGLAGAALERQARILASRPTPASCPAAVPVQTVTVINQANVRPWALAKVENAVVVQSLQLRAAWGTPCVQFGAGGWPIYLKGGSTYPWGEHFYNLPDGPPYAYVYTGATTYVGWSQSFSHEALEMLVDPTTAVVYSYQGETAPLEVSDPVEAHAYRLDGVWVSDFVLPAYFAGAALGECGETACWPSSVGQTTPPSPTAPFPLPPVAPAATATPYDHMGVLSAAWSAPGTTTAKHPSLPFETVSAESRTRRRYAPMPTTGDSRR